MHSNHVLHAKHDNRNIAAILAFHHARFITECRKIEKQRTSTCLVRSTTGSILNPYSRTTTRSRCTDRESPRRRNWRWGPSRLAASDYGWGGRERTRRESKERKLFQIQMSSLQWMEGDGICQLPDEELI